MKRLSLLFSLLLTCCTPAPMTAQEPGAYWRHSRPETTLPIHVYITPFGPKQCAQFAGCAVGPMLTSRGYAYVLWVHRQSPRGVECTLHHEVLHALGWDHDDTRAPQTTDRAICGFHIPHNAAVHIFYEKFPSF